MLLNALNKIKVTVSPDQRTEHLLISIVLTASASVISLD